MRLDENQNIPYYMKTIELAIELAIIISCGNHVEIIQTRTSDKPGRPV
jgi:hypothetical protein